ncbi:MAG: hypothetical protein ACTSYE_12555, partial [Alphaproteobacteria bacterium]
IRNDHGHLPFTGLLFLGVSDGAGIKQAMEDLSIDVPQDLSVHILGHCDVPSEHFGAYSMSGSTAKDAISALIASVTDRLEEPHAPPRIVYLPIRRDIRQSTAAPTT